VGQSRSAYQIVVEPNALPATLFAATELQELVKRSTGVSLPIVAPIRRGDASIVIRADADLSCDGFVIEVAGRDVVITGHDSEGEPRTINYFQPVCCGTAYGVYEFLERFLGVRFYWPDDLGTIIPRREQIEVPDGFRLAQNPHFYLRRLQYGPNYVNSRKESAVREWGRRLRLGASQPTWFDHNWWRVLDVEEWANRGHPEYAALVDGKRTTTYYLPPNHRGGFVCTSHPEVVDIFVNAARSSAESMFSVSPNDGPGKFCECDACQRLDNGGTVPDGTQAGKRDLSDRMVWFYNTIAERADRPVGGYAYSQYIELPAHTKVHPQVSICLAINNAYLSGDPVELARAERLYRGWGAYTPRTIGYDILYLSKQMPNLIAPLGADVDRRVRLAKESGLAGAHLYIAPEMELGGADAYVAARLLWNPNVDANRLRENYYRDLYGRGWEHVRGLYERAEQAWRTTVSKYGDMRKRQKTMRQIIPDLRRALEAAERESGEDLQVRERLNRLRQALDRMDGN
jgi:hypothetical protein